MARFIDSYPEYTKMQDNVSKHVTLVTEMSKLVEARKLMLVSQTEQGLACNGSQGAGSQGAAYEVVNTIGECFISSLSHRKIHVASIKITENIC
ncbi:hypothetical protein HA466_0019010 [Hirschfeldia incana]|nr:hypothetical protein HA466_0019010 [Hirschfeldia incana]KAJ0265654.1 hypothetical protein HA466_0019010 [Hirschfeldia incana]KAJ0265655.1 hypothetical protein HA466_0019010 [Hirschfeldia incana]